MKLPLNKKIILYILSILLLLTIIGWESWQNLLVVVGAITFLILVRSERVIILLASILILTLPITYWLDPDVVVYLGNAIYILLWQYIFLKVIDEGELRVQIKWDNYINYLYLFMLLIVLTISGISIYQALYSPGQELVTEEINDDADLTIDLDNLINMGDELVIKLEGKDNIGEILVSIKKPDNKWVTFENDINSPSGEINIYNEVVDQVGNYQITVTSGMGVVSDNFEVTNDK